MKLYEAKSGMNCIAGTGIAQGFSGRIIDASCMSKTEVFIALGDIIYICGTLVTAMGEWCANVCRISVHSWCPCCLFQTMQRKRILLRSMNGMEWNWCVYWMLMSLDWNRGRKSFVFYVTRMRRTWGRYLQMNFRCFGKRNAAQERGHSTCIATIYWVHMTIGWSWAEIEMLLYGVKCSKWSRWCCRVGVGGAAPSRTSRG